MSRLGRGAILGAAVALVALGTWPAPWRAMFGVPYEDLLYPVARRWGVDPLLVAAVVRVESRGRPHARSRRGALGLMQVMPATGRWIAQTLGEKGFSPQRLYDPATNLRYGTWYLAFLLRRYRGDVAQALAAYNSGEGTVDRWRSEGVWDGQAGQVGRIPYLQTRDFVQKVEAAYAVYMWLYRPAGKPQGAPRA
jgi:soluble lytic murein transglycosylase